MHARAGPVTLFGASQADHDTLFKRALSRMVWRVFSNRQSVEREEMSALAIIETTVAIGISITIYLQTGSIIHILFGAVVAPFLLLSTPDAANKALDLSERVLTKIPSSFDVARKAFALTRRLRFKLEVDDSNTFKYYSISLGMFFALILWFLLGIFGFVIFFFIELIYLLAIIVVFALVKTYIILANLLTNPRQMLAAIPANWRKSVLCLDSATLPEILPGIEGDNGRSNLDQFKLSSQKDGLKVTVESGGDHENNFRRIKGGNFLPFVVLFIAAYAYRLSLKSTAIFWSPLLWIVGSISELKDLPRFSRHVVTLTWYRISRYYSTAIIFLFGAKIVCLFLLMASSNAAQLIEDWNVAKHYIMPMDLPMWQMAGVVNAGLAWALLFMAEPLMDDPHINNPQRATELQNRFWTLLIIRNILTVYTVFCAIYITAEIASNFTIPPLRVRVFPWQQ